MTRFGRRPDSTIATAVMGGAASLSNSRLMGQLIGVIQRHATAGQASRALLLGPASARSIETFHGIGCRVTVDGDALPASPIALQDGSLDLVIGGDALDRLPDDQAQGLAQEWCRILKSGGKVFLLCRRDPAPATPFLKIDIHEDGSLRLNELEDQSGSARSRLNAELQRLVKPLMVDEIFQRRDGWREIVLKRV